MAVGKRVKVAEVGEVPEGEGRVVEADGRTLALFNVSGTFYALDNACAHRGGPLGEGDLDGRLANNPAVTMACYPVHAEPAGIFVELA